jgi:hypothetical protein
VAAICLSEAIGVFEAKEITETSKDGLWDFSNSHAKMGKKSKKSKVSEKRAIFES